VVLLPLACWDCGFESLRGVDLACECYELSGRGRYVWLIVVHRGPAECGREAWILRKPWPTRGCCAILGGGQINCSFFSYYFFPPLSNQASFNYEIFGVSLYCTFSTASTVKSLLPAGWRQCTSVLRTSSSGLVPRYRKKRCVSKFVTRAHHTCVEPYRASCTSSTSVESPRSASSLIWWKVLNEPEILRFNFVKNNRI
jgi:hypothetical protein